MSSPTKSAPVIDYLRRRGYRVTRAGNAHRLWVFNPGRHDWNAISLRGSELWAFAKLEGL